jgi:hypothetical protein
MSATSVAFNPAATTNAAGLFSVTATGLIQGTSFDDPVSRFRLAGGTLASTETLAMFGGVGIQENIAAGGFNALGNPVGRATAQTNLTGFAVFDQNGAAISSPQSPVPVTLIGGQVNFYRLGVSAGARLVLAIDPALISLDGGLITQQVSWDYTNQKIVAYDSVAALPIKILSVQTGQCKTVSYTSATSVATWVTSGNACAIVQL